MNFNDEYKKVRNKIRSYRINDLLGLIVSEIHQYEASPTVYMERQRLFLPWILLYILKMTFLHGETNKPSKELRENDFIKIYNKMHDLDGVYKKALLEDGVPSFLASIAFQQFWYQSGVHRNDFARVNYLFSHEEGVIADRFREINGFSITTYIELMVATYSIIEMSNSCGFYNFESSLTPLASQEDLVAFLKLISRTKEQLRQDLKCTGVKSPLLQFGENSPLYKFPLLLIDNKLVSYGKTIFKKSLLFNLYEHAKRGGEETNSELSLRFESYIGEVLSSSGATFFTEDQIAATYDGKKTDFLVIEENTAIMIEAKSVRLRPYEMVNPTSSVVVNALEDNVLKAFFQGHELSANLNVNEGNIIDNYILLIVTYDDMHVGPFNEAYNLWFGDYCNPKFESGECQRGPLESENVFIASIKEFEHLCACRNSENGLTPLFERAIADNRDPETRKFMLSQSLPNQGANELPFITEQFEGLWNRVIEKFKQD